MQTLSDDVMTGVAGRVQDARPSGAPDAGHAPARTMAAEAAWRISEGEGLNRVRHLVQVQPLAAVLVAAVAGLLVGVATGRRRG